MQSRKSSRTNRTTATFAGNVQRASVEFNPDYTNVKRDLKRIGILAGSFFGLLILIAIVLPLTPFGK